MFCELCVYPCPKDCIHMGTEFAFVSADRSEIKHDLLSYKGMDKAAKIRMREAEAKKKAKEEAKAAKAAAEGKASAVAEAEADADADAEPDAADADGGEDKA